MSATYSNKSRPRREPLTPEILLARLFVAVVAIGIGLSVFVLPWLFSR